MSFDGKPTERNFTDYTNKQEKSKAKHYKGFAKAAVRGDKKAARRAQRQQKTLRQNFYQ